MTEENIDIKEETADEEILEEEKKKVNYFTNISIRQA